MLRSGATRSVLRSLSAASKPSFTSGPLRQQCSSKIWTAAARRPQALAVGLARPLALVRMQSDSGKPLSKIDTKAEQQLAQERIEPNPELVSSTSSVHQIRHEVGVNESAEDQTEMLAGIKHDLNTIRETFSLENVPREAYYIGMAGVVPYLFTSLSTFFCAYEIHSNAVSGAGLLFSEKQAELLLHILEPLQLGYGATIISFLGAIHWGLEFAGYGGYHGYPRYSIGVVCTALAWPTILLPAEYGLIAQFLIFNFLYYTDSRAAVRGWAPPWYGMYRFVLTFIVGGAILVSLIGRGQIADRLSRLPGPAEKIQELRDSQEQNFQSEEEARRALTLQKDESEDDEEEDGDEEDSEE